MPVILVAEVCSCREVAEHVARDLIGPYRFLVQEPEEIVIRARYRDHGVIKTLEARTRALGQVSIETYAPPDLMPEGA